MELFALGQSKIEEKLRMAAVAGALSDLIEDGGVMMEASSRGELLESIDRDVIIQLFERHGVILFRGFDLTPERIVGVTDSFTQSYAQDGLGRPRRFGTTEVGSITDWGFAEIGLHSEAAFAPVWPEMIWFYCRVPSTASAHTTICDGVALWAKLQPSTQRFFLGQPVIYHYTVDLGAKNPEGTRSPWPFQTIGVHGFMDRKNGLAELTITRFAVSESRDGKLCFANHVFNDIPGLTTTTYDGKPLPDEIMNEINEKGRALTHELRWQAKDLVMLDNRRFTHGRRPFDSRNDPRDIVQVQSALSSFAYGSTLRQGIQRSRVVASVVAPRELAAD